MPHLGCFLRPCCGGRLAQRHSTAFPAAHNWLWRTASEKDVVYGMLFSIPLSLVICPLAFNVLPWQWLIKKVNFHLKLPGIRQSSSLLDAGRLSHKALIRTSISLMPFFTFKSTLTLYPTHVLGPKDYKVQNKKNPKQTKRP